MDFTIDNNRASMTLKPPGKRRYAVMVLCLCVTTICYADRTNIGVAVSSFVDEKEQQGLVLAAFFCGYVLTQIPGGFFAERIGAKKVLLAGVICWAIFDMSTIINAKCLPCLFVSRIGVGLGEGILVPCMHHISAAWYPRQERSQMVAFVASGGDLGTVFALTLSPWLLGHFGWESIFLVFGCFSCSWAIAFTLFGANKPEDDKLISNEEKKYIISNRVELTDNYTPITTPHNGSIQFDAEPNSNHALNWKVLLMSRPAWAIYIAHFCFNYGWFVLLSWVPQYFTQEMGLNLRSNGFLAGIPYICGYFGTNIAGKLGDMLVAKGYRVLTTRRFLNSGGMIGAAFFLFCLRFAETPAHAVILLSLSLFFGRAISGGFFVNIIDIAPDHAGHVMGVSNTIAAIPGFLGNIVTGYVLEKTGSWNIVFSIASIALVFGAACFHLFSDDKCIYKANELKTQTQADRQEPLLEISGT